MPKQAVKTLETFPNPNPDRDYTINFEIPCFDKDPITSARTAVWVVGFMLMQNGISNCPVFTPNGTQGRTPTFAPACHAILADSAAKQFSCILSVSYGRW